jgi:hypothetical protein
MLHNIMERAGLRAWEVARTCILSRRWRRVWASAPYVDLRDFPPTHGRAPENFSMFVDSFLSSRERSVSLDTLRLLNVPTECERQFIGFIEHEDHTYGPEDVARWVTAAIKGGARVIEVRNHPKHLCDLLPTGPGYFEIDNVSIASSRLEQLKLENAVLGGKTLEDLSNHCPSLQVLELTECILAGSDNILSDSLKSLTMDECSIWADLSVAAPNLVSLRCVKPFNRAPTFATMGSLSTATIILLDSFLATTDHNFRDQKLGLIYSDEYASYLADDVYGDDAKSIDTCLYGELADDSDDDEQSSADPSEDDSDDDEQSSTDPSEDDSDDDELAHTLFGGYKLLLSLSNATSLDLIAAPGEVYMYA